MQEPREGPKGGGGGVSRDICNTIRTNNGKMKKKNLILLLEKTEIF
jgi:hypothetical protein